jgi:hypothetical protein
LADRRLSALIRAGSMNRPFLFAIDGRRNAALTPRGSLARIGCRTVDLSQPDIASVRVKLRRKSRADAKHPSESDHHARRA